MLFRYFIVLSISYLLGSVSSSVLLSKGHFHKDIRREGSGNAGATNMARVFGMGPGAATLGLDVLKALLACGIGLWLLEDWGLLCAGLACNLGHCYPLYFGFKGGKGVSVGVAVTILLGWKVLLCSVLLFFLIFFLSRKISLCSILSSLALPILCLLFSQSLPRILLALLTALLILFRHIPNIRRLLKGEESEFHPKNSKK